MMQAGGAAAATGRISNVLPGGSTRVNAALLHHYTYTRRQAV
jgi:hypothetical protein